jgi:hypothetical protein
MKSICGSFGLALGRGGEGRSSLGRVTSLTGRLGGSLTGKRSSREVKSDESERIYC